MANPARRLYQTFKGPAVALAIVLLVGTLGYRMIGETKATWLDCFYMTFITIATIGFGEVIDLSQSQTGRAFTIVVATFGIGVYSYALSKTTAFLIEGEFDLARPRPDHILIALRSGGRWQFNPGESLVLGGGEVIIAMATPDGRKALEVQFA